MTEFENQTLHLLRELRAELFEMRQELRHAIIEARQNNMNDDMAAIARVVAMAKDFEHCPKKL